MSKLVSCGVVIMNTRRELFMCHATGTQRWDLPKGLQEPGESALETALREAWEETSLALDSQALLELGIFDYLPAKRLHLFAVRVAVDAIEPGDCRCHSNFPNRVTGLPTPEVDAYAWKPLDRLEAWCGKNLSRVLRALDWPTIERLPELARVALRSA